MPLDIQWFRQRVEDVKRSEQRRGRDASAVDEVVQLDKKWRECAFASDNARRDLGLLQAQITSKKKESRGADKCENEMQQKSVLEEHQRNVKIEEAAALDLRNTAIHRIGNILDASVPSTDQVIRQSKFHAPWRGTLPHYEAMQRLNFFDQDRGCKVAGHRGYFLRGASVLLNMALVNYGLAFLIKKGFTPMQPPFFMKKDIMKDTAELADFDDQLYKISESGEESKHYLIATSEQPMTAYHRKEWLDSNSLPLKYAGVSTCFRKEAGSHGKDTLGLFRLHQFEKVEQFCITTPEESSSMHEEILRNAEEFYETLELPYQVVAIGANDLNLAASKKYDLEAFFPADGGSYRELVSCSNCTDYQSQALEVRIQDPGQKRYVHMLNGTLVATERTMCCIVEQHQTPDGVEIPRVLRPYMHGMDFLPWQR